MTDNRSALLSAIAMAWCTPENEGKEVDDALADAIAENLDALGFRLQEAEE